MIVNLDLIQIITPGYIVLTKERARRSKHLHQRYEKIKDLYNNGLGIHDSHISSSTSSLSFRPPTLVPHSLPSFHIIQKYISARTLPSLLSLIRRASGHSVDSRDRAFRLGNDVPRMQHAGDPAQNRKADVDEEVRATARLEEYRNRRKEERKEVEEDIALLQLLEHRSSAVGGVIPLMMLGGPWLVVRIGSWWSRD